MWKPVLPVLSSPASPEWQCDPELDRDQPLHLGRLSGWMRLKKQMLEEPEEPKFPGPEPSPGQVDQGKTTLASLEPRPPASRASKMWDAVLYRVSVAESRSGQAGPGAGVCTLAGLRRLPKPSPLS